MPYRRLPNTDQARLNALQNAVMRAGEADFANQFLQYKTLTHAQKFVMQFENMLSQYKDNYNTKVNANKQYRHIVQNARIYLSHFIQVFNLSVIRGEIKAEQKTLYGLSPTEHVVPDLSTDEQIFEWGQKIIDGEKKRTQMGGFPIYNPAISKVQVHYDIFKEHMVNHSMHKKTVTRVQGNMEVLRQEADELILEIWNQVEEHYKDLFPYEKLCRCQEYGIKYYYRPKEKHLSAETDKMLKENQDKQGSIQWFEME